MSREIKLDGKRVLVVGMARTGIATAKFLKARGSVVSTTEAKPEVEMREAIEELKGWAEPKIIVRFWIIGLILGLIAISTLKIR